MAPWVWVFLGGGIGSLVRWSLSEWLPLKDPSSFPWATLLANVLASLILGYVVGQLAAVGVSDRVRYGVIIGLCGGLSTFSTWSRETFDLLQQGAYALACVYMAISIAICVVAVGGGYALSGVRF